MGTQRNSNLANAVQYSATAVGFLCLVTLADVLLNLHLAQYGIVPRSMRGLIGIVWSPLLHAGFGHLAANAMPLFVLLILLLADRRYYPVPTLAMIWIVGGLGTWIIGRGGSVHIGASGVIFGLAAYLLIAGFYIANWRTMIVTLLVFVLFGGIFYGVLPHAGPISWEAHLCGMLAGIGAARANHSRH